VAVNIEEEENKPMKVHGHGNQCKRKETFLHDDSGI
jgi:hypothetical protein